MFYHGNLLFSLAFYIKILCWHHNFLCIAIPSSFSLVQLSSSAPFYYHEIYFLLACSDISDTIWFSWNHSCIIKELHSKFDFTTLSSILFSLPICYEKNYVIQENIEQKWSQKEHGRPSVMVSVQLLKDPFIVASNQVPRNQKLAKN